MPTIRRATPDDLEPLITLRLALLRELTGAPAGEDEAALVEATRMYIAAELPAGRFLAWLAEVESATGDRQAVGCGGLVYLQKPPLTGNLSGREAYIMNMYTAPAWRGCGIAARLVEAIVEHARAAGVRHIRLHASASGRPVYERAGFVGQNAEMIRRG